MFKATLLNISLEKDFDRITLKKKHFTEHKMILYERHNNIKCNRTRFTSLSSSFVNIEKSMCKIDVLKTTDSIYIQR